MADTVCHVTGATPAAPFIIDDCDATRGTSGGPLLTRSGKGWAVAAISIAATPGGNVALPASILASGRPNRSDNLDRGAVKNGLN